MPGIQSIHTPSMPDLRGLVPANGPAQADETPTLVRSAFAGAGNVPREAAADARPLPSSQGLGACLRPAWSWVRNALAHALPARTSTTEGYCFRELTVWSKCGEASENRIEAVHKIHEYFRSGSRALDFEGLGLHDLPPLPKSLAQLNCAYNMLFGLPKLPATLTDLDCSRNPLFEWPALPRHLQALDARDCGFTRIGELPESLTYLVVGGNRITELPAGLPRGLIQLDAPGNLLTTLPAGIDTLPLRFARLYGNPLDAGTLASIARWNEARGHVAFVTDPPARAHASDLAGVREIEAADARDPEGAFKRFLGDLAGTVNAAKQPDFARELAAWRDRLEANSKLRELSRTIALAATASCEDRITLTYLAMRRAESNLAVASGALDHDAAALLDTARQTMREEALDRIAYDKIRALEQARPARAVDDIEVILHYRTGVGDVLPQAGAVREGRFASELHSRVTRPELQAARASLQRLDADFPRFLSNWSPWHDVLARWNPAAVAAADARRAELADPDAYMARVHAFLAAEQPGFEDDAAAQVRAGPAVLERLNHEVYWPLTQQFLRERGFSLD